MFASLLLFFILLLLLFFLSQRITTSLFQFFYFLTRQEKLSVGLLSFFLLPGTLIHELSHFLLAVLLRVKTGRLSLLPEIEKNGVVKTGRLELAQTDPFRRTLIGLAPLIIGLTLIYFLGKYLFSNFSQLITHNSQPITILLLFIICYLLFTISTTMFSSKKDLESLIVVGPLLLITMLLLEYFGVKIFIEEKTITEINLIFMNLNRYLLIANLLDYFLFFLLVILLKLLQKIIPNQSRG